VRRRRLDDAVAARFKATRRSGSGSCGASGKSEIQSGTYVKFTPAGVDIDACAAAALGVIG